MRLSLAGKYSGGKHLALQMFNSQNFRSLLYMPPWAIAIGAGSKGSLSIR